MLRRPKVQFKPKISTGSESKPVQGKSTPVKQSAPIIGASDPVCEVSDYVAIEATEVSVDANLLVAIDPATPILHTIVVEDPATPVSHTIVVEDPATPIPHTIVVEPREVPLINIPSSQSSIPSNSSTKRTRGSRTTIEIVGEDNDLVTPRKQSSSLQKHLSGHVSGQSSRKRPKICLSSSKQNLPLDRSKVTMYDLLSYNPPLSEEQKERRRKEREEASASDSDRDERSSLGESPFKVPSPVKSVLKSHNSPPPSQQPPSQQSTASECVLKSHNSPPPCQRSTASECDASDGSSASKVEASGPRVKIGADGNIVIDEESLIVKRVDASLSEVTVINEGKVGTSSTNYESFRKRKTTRNRWTEDETVKFYHALSAIGTDFSLMADTFFRNTRSREELRNKFKKEEKTKTHLIDSAMAQTNLKYATDYLEKVNKKSPPLKPDGNKSPSKSQQSSPSSPSKRQLPPTRKSPRNVS